jgi:hypothetical protein
MPATARPAGARRPRRPSLAGSIDYALPSRRRHHARGSRWLESSWCCRRLSPACLISAAMSNCRMRVAASSGPCRRRVSLPVCRSAAGEKCGARRVIRRTDMCRPSGPERCARWCDTIITESFWRGSRIGVCGIQVRECASSRHAFLDSAIKDVVDLFSRRIAAGARLNLRFRQQR